MRNDKHVALKLRLLGNSYSEINSRLGIPKSTLSGWFSKTQLSELAKEKIYKNTQFKSIEGLLKRNRLQTHLSQQRALNTRKIARSQIGKLSTRELQLIGSTLYWAEGYKRPVFKNGKVKTYHAVTLTNSDPLLIKVYLRFLRDTCKIKEEKISAQVRIYEHHNREELLNFWHGITNIPIKQFESFYYGVSKSSLNKKPFNTLPHGTIRISVNNTELYHRIMGWIEGLGDL